VLLRALAPLSGIEAMAARRFGPQKPSLAGTEKAVAQLARPKPGAVGEPHRPAWRIEDLCSGPAKLCQAFGLDRGADGYDLISGEEGVLLLDDGTPLPFTPEVGTRIGLASNCASGEEPWRWWVPGEPSVSRRRNR
jgi:3-methyladenine DNA glycosylase Mpg